MTEGVRRPYNGEYRTHDGHQQEMVFIWIPKDLRYGCCGMERPWGIEVQAAIAIPNMADPFSRPARSNGSQWDPAAKNK